MKIRRNPNYTLRVSASELTTIRKALAGVSMPDNEFYTPETNKLHSIIWDVMVDNGDTAITREAK